MYDFLLYFLYDFLDGKTSQPRITARITLSVIIAIQIVTIAKILKSAGIIDVFPHAPNKFVLYIPVLIYMGFVLMVYSEKKLQDVVSRFSGEHVYSFRRVMGLVLNIVLPIGLLIFLIASSQPAH